MAKFLQGDHINSKLHDIIVSAHSSLILISPFIKFHSRIKEVLRTKIDNPELAIVVVFGKNESNKKKSLSEDDFNFLSDFPNIVIKHEPRLHAKYYANDTATLLSSMNLYEFSQNNNIEFGIYAERKDFISNLIDSNSLDAEAWNYFNTVIENAETIFEKEPAYKDKFLGLSKEYSNSKVLVDKRSELFKTTSKKAQTKEPIKNSELVSATVLGKEKGISYKKVLEQMISIGYVNDEKITAKGSDNGLQYKTNKKGDSWIVYPKELAKTLTS